MGSSVFFRVYHVDTLLCPGARDKASLRLMYQCCELLGSTPGPAVFLLGLRMHHPPERQGSTCLWNTCECHQVPSLCSSTPGPHSGIWAACCCFGRIDWSLFGYGVTLPLPQKQGSPVLKARCSIWSGDCGIKKGTV